MKVIPNFARMESFLAVVHVYICFFTQLCEEMYLSLVENRYIRRQAHWQRRNVSYYTIRAGSTNINHTYQDNNAHVQVIQVETSYIHPRYLAEKRINNFDIAMLRLSRPLILSGFAMPACLPEEGMSFRPGDECYLASWGSVKPRCK